MSYGNIFNLLKENHKKNWLLYIKHDFVNKLSNDTLKEEKFLNYLKQYNKPEIHIHTNGGMNGPKFFAELAECLKDFPFPTHVVFSIDGLEDTNHLYRRNVQWHKVMENAKSFIDAGGLARWRMIVFEHNAHQVEECERLAFSMGFKKFDIKLRVKGDRALHWYNKDQTSYKIDLRGDDRIWGLEEFSVQKPITRNYVYEYIFHKFLE